jgi:flagellar biosynthesis protein FlhB
MSSGEIRTFEATPRKVARARLAGQVALSRDLGSGAVLFAAWATLAGAGRSMAGGLVQSMRESMAGSTRAHAGTAALAAGARAAGEALAFPLIAMVVIALGIGLVQTRGLVRAGLLVGDGVRWAPRLRRLWRPDSVALAARDLAKVVVLLTVGAGCLGTMAPVLAGVTRAKPSRILEGLFATANDVGFALALAMAALGLVDYLWQVHRHRNALRMSQDEVKREHKEFEGDPVLKSERKRIHLQLAQASVPADLAAADVVVVDPGCMAVALVFDPLVSEAPVVLCKACDRLASRLESLASEAHVPVVVDANLVTDLISLEELDQIPEALYQAVAELLVAAKPALGLAGRTDVSDGGSETAHVH